MLPRRRGVEKFQKVNVVSLLKLFDNTKLLEHSVDRLTPHSLLPRLLGTFYRKLFLNLVSSRIYGAVEIRLLTNMLA